MSARAVPFGKYFLLERINVGGMAEVYKAKMIGVEGFEKVLAIKRILPDIAADEDFIKMFIDEAKISVQLNHANIAQTFELGKINDTYFIALEFVPGRDLRALFDRLRRRGEVVPPDLACYVMSRVAEALDYAHRKKDQNGRELGIIHRDISPQNILVSYEGEVKIIDFGIAKAAGKILKTQAGILKGKFGYMSPEQVRGLPLDRRSDLFAIGICLYELLVGDRLFTGDSDYSVLEKVRTANVPRPSLVRKGVPPQLERIVTRALAREPEDRYQHASELVADLQRYLLAQDRLFTREDLSAFMKKLFSDEFERERRAADDDATPSGPSPATPERSTSIPQLRASSLRADAGMRLEGAPARTPAPPPPPADAFVARGRLKQATLAAETDKVDAIPDDDETTHPELPPGESLSARPPRPPPPPDDLTPTPSEPTPNERPVADQPTRIGRAAPPPPVASRPPPPRANPSLPPRPPRLPPITDSLPEIRKAAPPPVAPVDDDEPTELGDPRPGKAVAPKKASNPAQKPVLPRGAKPVDPAKATLLLDRADDDESTVVADRAPRYVPRKKRRYDLALVMVLVVVVAGLAVWRVVDAQRRRRGEESAPPIPVPAPASPVWATLQVVTDPPDAQLFIDRELVKNGGEKPFETDRLEADVAHVLVARKEGFREAAASVTVAGGDAKRVSLTLKPRNAVLTVKTTPPGAAIVIDGRELAKTPETLGVLGPGTYALHVELKCFEPVDRTVTLGDDPQTVELSLLPRPGECVAKTPKPTEDDPGLLRLYSRPAATVYLDGRPLGRETPLLDFPVRPGTHTVRLVAGARSQELEVEVEPGKSVTKVVVLR